MESFFELMNQLKAWHWLSLALILLAVDAFATGGFLIGTAAAAFIVWLLKLTIPGLGWEFQVGVFSILSLIFTGMYSRVFKNEDQDSAETVNINNRAAQLIGREITLEKALSEGQNKLQIGDTLWKVESTQSFNSGEKIKVIAADGMTLKIDNI